jgi:hypothetical protein
MTEIFCRQITFCRMFDQSLVSAIAEMVFGIQFADNIEYAHSNREFSYPAIKTVTKV